jgi:hypothetical protein
LRRFARQFASPLIYIPLFVLAFDLGLWIFEGKHRWPIEATAIGLILLFNAVLGLYQEQRSEAASLACKGWPVRRCGSSEMVISFAVRPATWCRETSCGSRLVIASRLMARLSMRAG